MNFLIVSKYNISKVSISKSTVNKPHVKSNRVQVDLLYQDDIMRAVQFCRLSNKLISLPHFADILKHTHLKLTENICAGGFYTSKISPNGCAILKI